MLLELRDKAEQLGFHVEEGSIKGSKFITVSQGIDFYEFLAIFDDKTFILEPEHTTDTVSSEVKTLFNMVLENGFKNRLHNLDDYIYYSTSSGYYSQGV